LEDEKERQETEVRQRRLRRRQSSPTDELLGEGGPDSVSRNQGGSASNDAGNTRKSSSPDQKGDPFDRGNQGSPSKSRGNGGVSDSSAQEMLEAAARASLRTKFDHVGIDPHSPGSHGDRDVRHIADSRGMTNSPPPPSLATAPNMALSGHGGVSGFGRQHSDHPTHSDHSQLARVPSPILFPPGSESALHATSNMHMLQLHHAAALAGVSLGHSASSPLDLGSLGGAGEDLEVRPFRSLFCSLSLLVALVHTVFVSCAGGTCLQF
jgi:hypothetical protein